jgi:hypothetical protein
MKITYTPNPLNTVIELDAHEQELFKLKLRIEEYENMMFNAHWNLTRSSEYLATLPRMKTLEDARAEAIKRIDPEYWCSDDRTKLDDRIDELFDHYLGELSMNHSGDCTCFPCSCGKCHAEGMLGLDTTKGLSKYMASKIERAFSYKDGDVWKQRTLEEVLERMRGYDPKITDEGVDPGWLKRGEAEFNSFPSGRRRTRVPSPG